MTKRLNSPSPARAAVELESGTAAVDTSISRVPVYRSALFPFCSKYSSISAALYCVFHAHVRMFAGFWVVQPSDAMNCPTCMDLISNDREAYRLPELKSLNTPKSPMEAGNAASSSAKVAGSDAASIWNSNDQASTEIASRGSVPVRPLAVRSPESVTSYVMAWAEQAARAAMIGSRIFLVIVSSACRQSLQAGEFGWPRGCTVLESGKGVSA